MTIYESLSLVVGTMQCGLIYYGLHVMRAASKERAADMDQRHAEAMEALGAVRAGAAAAHEETMEALGTVRTGAAAAHEETMTALKALIEAR